MAKQSTFLNMTLCLGVVTIVCAALLGAVNILTPDAIAQAAVAKTEQAISSVVPAFDNRPASDRMTVSLDGESLAVYPAKQGDNPVGYAVEVSTSKGFGGTIKLMVGFDPDGNITGTSVISHSETPGLGSKMTEQKFYGQFVGKNPASFRLSVKKDGGDIDAITASTITSRAYADALSKAYRAFQNIKSNQNQSEK